MKMHFVFWSASQVSLSTIVIVTFTLGAEATFFVNCDGKSSLAFFLYVSSRRESCLQEPRTSGFFQASKFFS